MNKCELLFYINLSVDFIHGKLEQSGGTHLKQVNIFLPCVFLMICLANLPQKSQRGRSSIMALFFNLLKLNPTLGLI